MTSEQAINVLHNAVRSISTTAENHDLLAQAIGVIRAAVAPLPGSTAVDPPVADELVESEGGADEVGDDLAGGDE